MLAAGGRSVADMAALRDQPDLFDVASGPTIWRALRLDPVAVLAALVGQLDGSSTELRSVPAMHRTTSRDAVTTSVQLAAQRGMLREPLNPP